MPRDRNPSLSQTCLICRQKLINQLKLNYSYNNELTDVRTLKVNAAGEDDKTGDSNSTNKSSNRDVNKLSQWKALCLETFSMLFGLPVNHPFISVFANTDPCRRIGDTTGQLCNRCLQDVSNVQFVFWQFQNLEQKLSELQGVLFDRLRSNYEALPVALLFGKYIGVDDLKNDLQNLKYDEIVKILFEEIKSRKPEWPQPLHTRRWKEACKNSEHISQVLPDNTDEPNNLEDDSEPFPCISPETILSGLDHPDHEPCDIKVEVDQVETLPQLEDYPPSPEEEELITSDIIVKKKSSRRVPKKKMRIDCEEEEEADDNCDALWLGEDEGNSDGEWTFKETAKVRQTRPAKRKNYRLKKTSKKSKINKPVVVKALSALSGVHQEDSRFLCTEDPENCTRTYGSKKHLRNHVEKFHKARKFPCDEEGCSAKFQTPKSLAIHMVRAHQKKRPKELCSLCGLEFSHKEMRKHYYFRHQGIGNFKCERCSMDFMELEQFQNHEQLHQSAEYPFLCVVCQQLFTNSLDLKAHVTSNHLSSGLKCHICNVMKPNEFLMQRHLKIHERQKTFLCKQCGKAFSTLAYLRYHEDHFHVNSDRTFPCEICGKTFKHEKNVKRHLISHQEEKPFKCSQCPKTFNYSHLLKKHEEIHSGTKNYECDLCGKRFRQEQNLRQHMKSHRPKPEKPGGGRKRAVKTEEMEEEPVGEISYEIHQDASDKDAIPMILQVKGDIGTLETIETIGSGINMNAHLSQHHQMITTAEFPASSSAEIAAGNIIEATIIPAAEITEDEHGNPTAQYETVQEIQLHHTQDYSQTQTATVVFLYEYNA